MKSENIAIKQRGDLKLPGLLNVSDAGYNQSARGYRQAINTWLKSICAGLLVTLFMGGCTDAWEDHITKRYDSTSSTAYQYLKSDGRFSSFVALVDEAGLSDTLAASTQISVFAVSNAQMANVPAQYLDDLESKRLFLRHHITHGRINLQGAEGNDTLRMFSNKRLVIGNGAIDGVAIRSSSQALQNGFVNEIEAAILPRPSIWDFVTGMAPANKHVNYLNSLTKRTFDVSLSTQIGFNDRGQPVYDSVFVYRNWFNDNIADLSSEDSTLTLFIVADEALASEYNKFWRFYRVVTGATARDTAETMMRITRDWVFGTAFSPGEVPSNPLSLFNVPVNFNQGAVISHFRASNGYVYILSSAPVNVADRIQPVVVEGESPLNYFGLPTERGVARGYLRIRNNASGGRDFVLDNHISGPRQRLTDGLIMPAGFLPSITYRVYWRAINDFSTSYRFPSANQLTQQLGTTIPMTFDRVTGRVTRFAPPAIFTGFIPVTAAQYSANPLADEVFVGTLTFGSMREVYLQLLPEGVLTHHMAVTVDYIRLVPVLN